MLGGGLWRAYSSSPPSSSLMRSTETTRSPSAVSNTITPWVERPAMRMPLTGQRMSLTAVGDQHDLVSLLNREGGDEFADSSAVIAMAVMPLPPRPGRAVFVRRRALAETVDRNRQHELLDGGEFDIALRAQFDPVADSPRLRQFPPHRARRAAPREARLR